MLVHTEQKPYHCNQCDQVCVIFVLISQEVSLELIFIYQVFVTMVITPPHLLCSIPFVPAVFCMLGQNKLE